MERIQPYEATDAVRDDASVGVLDVVVVGGGVSGCYSAWRLKTGTLSPAGTHALPADPAQRKILLLESSLRIGGRLESLDAPGTNGLQAEFGGMGYSVKNDTTIASYVQHMGLPAVDFPMPDDHDFVYVRGVRIRNSDLTDPTMIPYRLAADEEGKGAGALIEQAIEKVIPGSSKWTTQQWWDASTTYEINGRKLGDYGYWNILAMGMSNEAFEYCIDTMGHFFEFDNWNAAQAIPWLLTQSIAPYKTIQNGYDQLPISAWNEYLSAGGWAMLKSQVTAVTHDGTSFVVSGTDRGGAFNYRAHRVILAMPQRALQKMAPGSVVLSEPAMQAPLDSVTGRKVMKIFLTFDTAWWNQIGITKGSSSTDLPLSQCWYFDPAHGQGDALLMASYNDTLKTTFWQGLEGGTPFANPNIPAPPPGFWADQVPSQAMVDEVLRQLTEMHQIDGGVTIPTPKYGAYKDWTHDPFGGAYSTWNVGVDVPSVALKMLRPDLSLDLHIVGSTFSQDQGWAEGAFTTAEEVMQTYVGLEAPTWLS